MTLETSEGSSWTTNDTWCADDLGGERCAECHTTAVNVNIQERLVHTYVDQFINAIEAHSIFRAEIGHAFDQHFRTT
jgi:hypothetical protein